MAGGANPAIHGRALVRVSLRSSQQVHLSPQGRGRNGRLAPIPGEGATTRKADPPHPDRASAIRPLPFGERYRGLHYRVVIERHRNSLLAAKIGCNAAAFMA